MPTPYFIAEVSSNHAQDLDRCLKFVEVAASIGCDAVKFQLFRLDRLFAPEILSTSEEHQRRREWELPLSFIPEIHKHCKQHNIAFCCTPFYLEAVKELQPYVDFYKIASYELLWHDLIQACAQTNKPLVLSTGMANNEEIAAAVKVARDAQCRDLTLLHCVSAYPTPVEQCNLSSLEAMRDQFNCPTGWSDHSTSPAVLYRACHTWKAEMVEFHLDLDANGAEFGAGHCWLPEEIQPVIENIKQSHQADGSPAVTCSASEQADRDWRADPSDGLRPLKRIRQAFSSDVCTNGNSREANDR